ncbi:fatty acid desaturase [Rhizobium sp. CFBP 8762]|uniref:fatty acid desaturase n=1 Tax=Rhizobium sp. CFBP 8762 TaxID=2775279 RepID=UPI00178487B0|nr:fatty acid desaturase [Rhizobium sp. CFBP 8762]MBD8555179.1 fatty acid desaturase [Rhizobium sp. CFBP 8762]
MLPENFLQPVLLCALALSFLFRGIVWFYYRDGKRILPLLKLASNTGITERYYKPLDNWLSPLPFLYCWLEIFSAVLFFRWTSYNLFSGALLAVVASGRMRALQEIGHNALHAALCPSKSLQWVLGNIFFQFPTVKRDMDSRFQTHVKDHHPNADIPGKDPNLKRVIRAGMVPGITTFGFVMALFYPISPKGVLATVKGNLSDAMFENSSSYIVFLRVLVTVSVIGLYLSIGGPSALVVGWIIPVFLIYPLFAWWSLLSKHRWHTTYIPTADKRAHDYEHGRATDFPGLFGIIHRYLIFPMSDAYHLAHHIYPFVRSEYLPEVDRALKVREPRYTQYISSGMLFGFDGQPAALSELYHRLVRPATASEVTIN